MARTEMMLRLIKDDVVVGFEWHTSKMPTTYKSKNINIEHSKMQNSEKGFTDGEWHNITFYYGENYITHDSLEQGIKLPDGSWAFDNDMVLWDDGYGETFKAEIYSIDGILVIDYEMEETDSIAVAWLSMTPVRFVKNLGRKERS